jgi:hypothetical protein
MSEIRTRIGLDTSSFKSGLQDAQKRADMFGSGMKNLGRQIAGAFAVGSIINFTRSVIQNASAIGDQARSINVSTDAYQALSAAARDAGASQESIRKALQNTQTASQEAIEGNKAYADSFKNLGIDVTKFVSLAPERQLETIARAVANADNKQQAYNESIKILGTKNAPQLQEVLDRLASEGFDGLADAARRSGQIMNEETIKSLDKAADRMARFGAVSKVLAAEILNAWVEIGKAATGQESIFDKERIAAERLAEQAKKEAEFQAQLALEEGKRNLARIREYEQLISNSQARQAELQKELSIGIKTNEDASILNMLQERIREEVSNRLILQEDILKISQNVLLAVEDEERTQAAVTARREEALAIINVQVDKQKELNDLKQLESSLLASINAGDENAVASANRLLAVRKQIVGVEGDIAKAKDADAKAQAKADQERADRLSKFIEAQKILEQGEKDRRFKELSDAEKLEDIRKREADAKKRANEGDVSAAREYNNLVSERIGIEKKISDERMRGIEAARNAELKRIDDILAKEKARIMGGSIDEAFTKDEQRMMRSSDFGNAFRREQNQRRKLGMDDETREDFARRKKVELLEKQANEAQAQAEQKAAQQPQAAPATGGAPSQTAGGQPSPAEQMAEQQAADQQTANESQLEALEGMAESIANIEAILGTLKAELS